MPNSDAQSADELEQMGVGFRIDDRTPFPTKPCRMCESQPAKRTAVFDGPIKTFEIPMCRLCAGYWERKYESKVLENDN